ncbi:MAG: ABC transporter ATP-binding protein [Rhodospirillaceae bacterium]|nr:ABC transporter ATP-binding protein [Rhodospirillaceae bacterium]
MNSGASPLLTLSDLRVAREDGRVVLDGVNFRLEAGERIGLIGPNGVGKSTLLHAIVGLLACSAGSIEVCGQVARSERDFAAVRRRAGLLFQDSDDQLFCPTVGEDVAFGPRNLGASAPEAAAIASRTLDRLGLAGFERRITYRLSGGEKRLVALATVLAMEPEVLLLDEPTTGLDEAAEARMVDLLLALPQAMIIVSHDRAIIDRLATRVVRLHRTGLETVSSTA